MNLVININKHAASRTNYKGHKSERYREYVALLVVDEGSDKGKNVHQNFDTFYCFYAPKEIKKKKK